MEGELALSCSCDRLGHVWIEIELASEPEQGGWMVRCVVVTEAGQLETIAEAMGDFFRGRRWELR